MDERYARDNRLVLQRVLTDSSARHLDVDSVRPGAVVGPKGLSVLQIKHYVSWVQTVVRQVGPSGLCTNQLRRALTSMRRPMSGKPLVELLYVECKAVKLRLRR